MKNKNNRPEDAAELLRIADEALRKSEERYKRITEAITDYIYTVRMAEGRAAETTHGPGCLAVTGYRAKEFAEDPFLWFHMVPTEDRPGVEEQALRILTGEYAPPIVHRIVHKNGTVRWVRNTFVPHRDEHGALVSYDGLIQDITELKRAEEALRESEKRFKQLFDLMARGVAIYQGVDDGQDFVFVDINRAGQSFSKIRRDEAVGRRVTEVFPEVKQNGLLDVFRRVWRTGQPEHHPLSEYVDGRVQQWVENHVLKLPSGLIVAIYSDITEKHRAEEEIRDSEERHRRIVESSSDAFLIRSGEIVIYVNPAALKLFRANHPGDLIGKRYLDLVHPDDRAISAEQLKKSIDENWVAPPREHRILALDGQVVHVESTGVSVKHRGETQAVGVYRDITERKRAEDKLRVIAAELEQMALTDFLTNLYNRRYFMQRGAEEFKRATRNSQPLALLMLDIDEFKKVNDTCGHEAGDLTLQQVAAALKSSLRETDIIGRLGGEEFAVLLPNTSLEGADLLAERVRLSVANTSFEMSPGEVLISTITISVGVAAFTDEMSGIDDLLRNADAALYCAKNSGRNCVGVYKKNSDATGVLPSA